MSRWNLRGRVLTCAAAITVAVGPSFAEATADAKAGASERDETHRDDTDVVALSPFEVSSPPDKSYTAATTLAGNRLNTELRDMGNAVSVVTSQFLQDIGATDNQTLLQYTTGTEVGNAYGNFVGAGDGSSLDESPKFINPNQNTRIRGLTSADNTRDYFLTDIPWEGFDVDGVDLQRGPNSILFGQGSPAGIINTRIKSAMFRNADEAQFRVGSFGSRRSSLDINRVLIKDELAIRLAGVYNDQEYKQDPAYSLDRRLFGATRWEPAFLKKGGARTIFKANFEAGTIRSNNPRTLPPIDLITPWFLTGTYQGTNSQGPVTYKNLNRETFIPSQLQDDNTGLPNHGQMRPGINGGPDAGKPNPYYNPWLGNFGQQFGGPLEFFNNNSPTATGVWLAEPNGYLGGIGPDGKYDGNLALPFQRPTGIATMASYAKNAGLPYSQFGIYKNKSLTDASIFDFYNLLLDGSNKNEWQNFRTYNLSLAQTFFNDQVGFEFTYNNEFYKNGQLALLHGDLQAIYIDINKVYADGTPTGKNGEPFADGTPNPNLGRPFVSDNGAYGNNSYRSNKDTRRLTLFGTHDFSKDGARTWFNRLLGRHTITGLFDRDENNAEYRSWQRYGADDAYEHFINGNRTPLNIGDNAMVPNTVIYLGPSLLNQSSAAGARIPNPSAIQTVTSGTVRAFDSTWAKSTNPSDPNYVDPAAYWHNDYYPAGNTAGDSTQSENPANYVGWRNVPITIINSESSPANRDKLTTSARLTRSLVTSNAFVWQGHFWDNALVGTWGVRKDIARSYTAQRNGSSFDTKNGVVNLSPGSGAFDPTKYMLPGSEADLAARSKISKDTVQDDSINRIQATSHSWTAVAHLNQLPYIKSLADKLPLQVSLFYNRSSDFQPAAVRVDLYGDPLAPPKGRTIDKGILLETNNGRFSVKLNRYETTATGASSSALGGAWFIGASQAWSGNWVNRFEFNQTGDTADTAVAVNDPTNSQYNYAPAPGETLAQAQAREAAVIAAWRTWQKSVDPRFYKAWGIDLNNRNKAITANAPSGFTVTEDSVSKGYEIEFNAMPTKNWRLTLNASKTSAVRTNIGGTALSQFVQAYEKALKTTPVGDLRIWWGGAGNETSLYQWNSNIGSEFAQRKLQEGTNVPELRTWRANLISNYDFDHGLLKGVNVGGGVRYESPIIIGYRPIPGADANSISFDIANPYKGPEETNFDLWIGYGRRIGRSIDWSIQLNLRNAFVGDELIPLTTQPDGTPASYRIRPPQTWQLTNTFKF